MSTPDRETGIGAGEVVHDEHPIHAFLPNTKYIAAQPPVDRHSALAAPAAPRIALIAGETSGDLLGAGLIEQLRVHCPGAEFRGIGGDAMRTAGCQTWYDASELALMGLSEILGHLPRLLKLRRDFRKRVLDWKPDVCIGIDAPDFNLPVERWLKQRGVRTVHYVSPSIWAWREKRARKIGTSADLVLCLFPMEPPIYQRYGIDARFVGHPMADEIPYRAERDTARAQLGLSLSHPVLAVLPGSRQGEIERLGDIFFAAAGRLSEQVPGLQILIPAANQACNIHIAEQLSRSKLPTTHARLLNGQARTAMLAADVVLLASGTATLEAMLLKRPMVVGYRVTPFTYRILSILKLIKIRRFALPNILANADIVPELIQDQCTPQALSAALLDWFIHPEKFAALQSRYLALHAQLRHAASARAAEAVVELLPRQSVGRPAIEHG